MLRSQQWAYAIEDVNLVVMGQDDPYDRVQAQVDPRLEMTLLRHLLGQILTSASTMNMGSSVLAMRSNLHTMTFLPPTVRSPPTSTLVLNRLSRSAHGPQRRKRTLVLGFTMEKGWWCSGLFQTGFLAGDSGLHRFGQ